MSNCNYMDSVPVKIAEKYKPPPRIYQRPQSVANKLNLPDGHFQNASQYSYDFQLERKVLAKIPEYKRKRQIEREARQERREKREKEHQRRVEEKHKQMLGAVSYPNDADICCDSDDGNADDDGNGHGNADDGNDNAADEMKRKLEANVVNKEANWLGSHSFNNILQPTVLTHNGDTIENNIGDMLTRSNEYNRAATAGSTITNSGNSNKLANTFNYKDFEEDTSSPFDNIELKTIDDLDILRQVLHNTQLKENRKETAELKDDSCNNGVSYTKENIGEINNKSIMSEDNMPQIANDMSTLENTKAALEKVDFSDINLGLEQQQLQQIDNIPTPNYKSIGTTNYYTGSLAYSTTAASNTTALALQPSSTCFTQNFSNGIHDQHNYQVYHNHNYLYSPNCNSNNSTITDRTLTEYSNLNSVPTGLAQHMHYIYSKNDNNILSTTTATEQFNSTTSYRHQHDYDAQTQQSPQFQEDDIQSTKSRSVPDLFQELRDEVRNSEMRRRRSRNYSHNYDGSKELRDDEENDKKSLEDRTPTNEVTIKVEDALESFEKLTSPVKALARNISSMGFPLGRVARVAQIYGEDDKKIVEHLIPLTELLDLGFNETQISEALLKFDNNKEKALEHLIS